MHPLKRYELQYERTGRAILRWRGTTLCFCIAWAALSAGCMSAVADAQVGGVSSTRLAKGRYGGAGQLAGGFSLGNTRDAEHFGPGADLRLKATEDITQVGIGPHAYWLHSSWTTPYARVGATLLELGRVDGATSIGSLGPRAEFGVFLSTFVISAFAEYDLRWSDQDNEGFFGLMLGKGFGISTEAPLPPGE